MRNDDYVGYGLRLTKAEMKRLDALAKATGRSKNGVMRALVRLAQPRDLDMLSIIRDEQSMMEAGDGNW